MVVHAGTLRAYKKKQQLEKSSVSSCADECGSQPVDVENIQVRGDGYKRAAETNPGACKVGTHVAERLT